MNKILASLISATSLIFGAIIISIYGRARGGEGALTILGFLGIPSTIVGSIIVDVFRIYKWNTYVCYVCFFLQYQVLSLLILKYFRFGK
jgi:hypothetical protein